MHILVEQGGTKIAEMRFETRALVIGSEATCDVHLPAAAVATRHARLIPDEQGAWYIEHLDETGVTIVNGSVVRERIRLHDGDEILIHDYQLTIHLPAIETEPSPTASEAAPPAREPSPAQEPAPGPGAKGMLIKKHDDAISLSAGRLHRACSIGRDLGRCGDIRVLMDAVLATVLQTFGAQRAWMGVRRQASGALEFIEGRTAAGAPCDIPVGAQQFGQSALERAECICLLKTNDEHESAMLVPLVGQEGTLGVLYVGPRTDGSSYQPTDLDLLRLIAQHAALQWEAIVRELVRQRHAVSSGVVVLGHEVQLRLDPRSLPQWDHLQLSIYCKPGQERFGDVYDVLRMPNGSAAFLLGHTDAGGADAVLMTTQATAAFRIAALHGDAPHTMLRELNWLIHDRRRLGTMECCALTIDPAAGTIHYAAAGHPRAVIIDRKGDPRILDPGNMPRIGLVKNVAYEPLNAQLDAGETLALFSPGIMATVNSRAEPLAEERFIECLCDGFGQTPAALLDELLTELREFLHEGRQPDDVTIILAHRR